MRLSVEDPRTGKLIKLEVKDNQLIRSILDYIIKQKQFSNSEERSYSLIFNNKELPNSITIKDAIHKFDLKEGDKLILWTRVIGG
ncbi:MAG: hypothetical protein JSV23_08630 [Promethearchaeota archaeon]|nr:MAG: hypothetical protein JSV23_08630 [Candidatus Lokiarchaeota archaeon]